MWIILALTFIVVGGLGLVVVLLERAEAVRSSSWPAASGRVTHAQLRQLATDTGYVYRADVAYEYRVGQRTYTGRRVRFFEADATLRNERALVERTLQQYAVGQPVSVYYDPRHPASAVLERCARPDGRVSLVLGAGLLMTGGIIGWLSLAGGVAAALAR